MVAFLMSILVAVVLSGLIVAYQKRRPKGTPLTWGEAMAGATYVFFLLFWVYGVVPHQWLTWADTELNWRPDITVHGIGGILKPTAEGGWLPFTLNYQHLRDLVAVGIYGVLLGGNIAMWGQWQKRGDASAKSDVARSMFGRPLVKEGVSS